MHDLLVLSDLHMGRGRNPETGRYHNLETFFYDDDLRRFLRHAVQESKERGRSLRVIFNGDTFDFLRAAPDPYADSRREQRFGSDLSPARAADLCGQHLRGHPIFVDALADVLEAGQELVFLPGNHDLEMQWAPVQDAVRLALSSRLATRLGPDRAAEALRRLHFSPWFHYEPGRIWIEHGCQYDSECAFRYPLRSKLGTTDCDPTLTELDQPLGNFFQRYLYNAFGPITFIVPSTRANARYSKWLLLNKPGLLLRVVMSHVPFIFQVLRRIANKGDSLRRPLKEAHDQELESLATASGLGEKLKRIDRLKAFRGDLHQTVREYGKQSLKFLGLGATGALVGAALWFSGFGAITQVDGFGLKALLFLALNFFFMAAALGVVAYAVLRQSPDSPTPLRKGAQAVCDVVDVPIVTFGHTHDEMVWRLDRPSGGRGWYLNTGTWIAVFTHDVLMPRERVQYTFLRVHGHEAELLHWSPGRGEAVPVVLLDDAPLDPALPQAPAVEPTVA